MRQCYARSLGGCSPKLSGEHYISRVLLSKIGPVINTTGFAFAGANSKSIPIDRLTAKILCTTHNRALSDLDKVGGLLFETLARFDQELAPGAGRRFTECVLVSGPSLERWLLKVYCGMNCAGGVFTVGGEKQAAAPIEPYMLSRLFIGDPMPPQLGPYFTGRVGDRMRAFNGMSVQLLSHSETGVHLGLIAEIYSFRFHLTFRPAVVGGTGAIEGGQFHPVGLELRQGPFTRELRFDWK